MLRSTTAAMIRNNQQLALAQGELAASWSTGPNLHPVHHTNISIFLRHGLQCAVNMPKVCTTKISHLAMVVALHSRSDMHARAQRRFDQLETQSVRIPAHILQSRFQMYHVLQVESFPVHRCARDAWPASKERPNAQKASQAKVKGPGIQAAGSALDTALS